MRHVTPAPSSPGSPLYSVREKESNILLLHVAGSCAHRRTDDPGRYIRGMAQVQRGRGNWFGRRGFVGGESGTPANASKSIRRE